MQSQSFSSLQWQDVDAEILDKEGNERHHQERDPEKRNCQGDNHSQKSAECILQMKKNLK